MKCLSIRQPWAGLIVLGIKPIENRSWETSYRGPILIHASLNNTEPSIEELERRFSFRLSLDPRRYIAERRGGIIGVATLEKIVPASTSKWFSGPFGWIMCDPRPLPFSECKGRLRLFDPDASIMRLYRREVTP